MHPHYRVPSSVEDIEKHIQRDTLHENVHIHTIYEVGYAVVMGCNGGRAYLVPEADFGLLSDRAVKVVVKYVGAPRRRGPYGDAGDHRGAWRDEDSLWGVYTPHKSLEFAFQHAYGLNLQVLRGLAQITEQNAGIHPPPEDTLKEILRQEGLLKKTPPDWMWADWVGHDPRDTPTVEECLTEVHPVSDSPEARKAVLHHERHSLCGARQWHRPRGNS